MSERFFSAASITSERVQLEGPEAHHLLHVMRARVGDEVILFDNSGGEFAAVVEKLGRSAADVRIVQRRDVDRELSFALTVGIALPKGDRQKWLVEKLTELGVTALVPLTTTRGVAQPTDSAIERLERSVIEACKQCGRNRLMQIAAPQTWDVWLDQSAMSVRLVAHPGGTSLAELDLSRKQTTQLAIGPEGGLTEAEVAAAIATGWQPVDLGPRILRVETAAIALAAALALR